jgi:hypothetical protein
VATSSAGIELKLAECRRKMRNPKSGQKIRGVTNTSKFRSGNSNSMQTAACINSMRFRFKEKKKEEQRTQNNNISTPNLSRTSIISQQIQSSFHSMS